MGILRGYLNFLCTMEDKTLQEIELGIVGLSWEIDKIHQKELYIICLLIL